VCGDDGVRFNRLGLIREYLNDEWIEKKGDGKEYKFFSKIPVFIPPVCLLSTLYIYLKLTHKGTPTT
jgi:hypothetical protein